MKVIISYQLTEYPLWKFSQVKNGYIQIEKKMYLFKIKNKFLRKGKKKKEKKRKERVYNY